MTTISVTSGHTSTVSTQIPGGTSYDVVSGGTLDVASGGVILGAVTANGASATVNVESGGTISGLLTMSGVGAVVSYGGVTEQTVIYDFGALDVSGVANSTTISSGDLYLEAGGTANDTIVEPYDAVLWDYGGVANSTTAAYYFYVQGTVPPFPRRSLPAATSLS
jgi:hypothetical protein